MLLATANVGKQEAFRRLLAGLPVCLRSPAELGIDVDVEETGNSFAENALLKARAFRDASGLGALADDSGLCVDALDGAPGLHSARFGGMHHEPAAQNELLLENMRGVSPVNRGAQFVSVIAFAGPDGEEWTATGAVRGFITDKPRGSNGFGYDPVFFLPGLGRTFAELTPSEKDPLSHRGQALRRARYHIEKSLGLLE